MGGRFYRSLKSDPETADIPVIVVSIVDDKNLGYSLGAAEYLTKPIDRERLLQSSRPLPMQRGKLSGPC